MEIELNKNKVVIIDDDDFEIIKPYKWTAQQAKNRYSFYAASSATKKGKKKNFLMHRVILGVTDRNIWVDHIDGNGLNNKRNNIRICTPSQNMCNVKARINKACKYKGVTEYKSSKKALLKSGEVKIYSYPLCWRAIININKKTISLGLFKNEIDAARAYDEAAAKYHGEFANFNFKK